MANNTLVMIPTYNEAGNVGRIYQEIKGLNLRLDLLFVDDNSPDGTGKLIDQIIEKDPAVHVLHRSGKQGIGTAHQEGIRWAYRHKYQNLITMDCDFSHSPEYIKEFLRYAPDHDVVVGSRYFQKGSLPGWNLYRKFLTFLGHFFTKFFLRMPYDATGAFRLYRLDRIPAGIFDLVESRGYSFFFESLYIISRNNFSIKEFSIHLPSRTYGHSKMSFKNAWHSLLQLVRMFWRSQFDRKYLMYSSRSSSGTSNPVPGAGSAAQIQAEWDHYWLGKKKSALGLYDLIAEFYRKVIIRPTLDHFIKKHFAKGAKVLHAGCGSGQVDTGIAQWVKISALDISLPALEIYKSVHQGNCETIHGDIFKIPAPDAAFDGIYNLGVMEHFNEEEIQRILTEFDRVLKPDGKLVIFWPPAFGLSVRALDSVHYVLNHILKRNVKLHPDEITRVRSRQHAERIFQRAGFKAVDYYFGVKDLFTHAVIVAAKSTERVIK